MSDFRRSPEISAAMTRGLGVLLLILAIVVPVGLFFGWVNNNSPPSHITAESVQLRPEMVILPSGTFTIGSALEELGRYDREAQHDIELTRPFAISRTEVTRAHYEAVMGPLPAAAATCLRSVDANPNFPVVCVSWKEVLKYANRLSQLEELDEMYIERDNSIQPLGNGYRLPTEAEWVYAAKAGTETRFVGTDSEESICLYDNVDEAFDCRKTETGLMIVGALRENNWGLLDIGGNAAEWVWDRYQPFSGIRLIDPAGPRTGGNRVVRGASWTHSRRNTRLAFRDWANPSAREHFLGFRIVRSCSTESNSLAECLGKN